MKNTLTLLCLTLVVFTNGCAFGQLTQYPWTAKIKVVDEQNNPVPGADVSVQYTILPPPTDPNAPTYGEIKGLTDDNGMFSASHADSSWTLGVSIGKTGCYTTHIGHELYQPGQFDDKTVAASRNPAFTLLLKKIGKPIAMYARRLNTHVPALDKPVGFDLMAGDWVAPDGKGANTDILFTGHFDKRADGESDFTLTVSFPKVGDGIQKFTVPDSEGVSGLRSAHEAPADGYQPQWVQTDNRKPGKPVETNRDPNRNYYFRVRTVLDSNGSVKSALYGKIYGDFMEFNYYLNPTPNDRNVEFDPKQNLLGGLESFEGVRLP